MNEVKLGSSKLQVPSIVVGCMRFADFDAARMNHYIHSALEKGAYYFDHADIYGGGRSEEVFGEALKMDRSIRRSDLFLQSKCGICKGYYDLSKEHIIESVEGSLKRLGTDYLNALLLHRPDALVEPEEVAAAFDELVTSGKVRLFGVSNHNPAQIELLKKYVNQPLMVNQLQFSIPVSNMVSAGMEVNMDSPGAVSRDGYVLDYSRLHDMTIQAWSPYQMPSWKGCYIGNDAYGPLNEKIKELSEKYKVSPTTIGAAWILRHPAHMQVIAGTTNEERLGEIIAGGEVELSREEWYELYLAAGHLLP